MRFKYFVIVFIFAISNQIHSQNEITKIEVSRITFSNKKEGINHVSLILIPALDSIQKSLGKIMSKRDCKVYLKFKVNSVNNSVVLINSASDCGFANQPDVSNFFKNKVSYLLERMESKDSIIDLTVPIIFRCQSVDDESK